MPTRRVLRRSLIGAALVLAVLLVVATATGVALLRRPFPVTEGQVALPGLGAEVSVQRDARGVPQIYADNPDDLFRAQGYVHAQDRFFEMDVRRHYAAGRLSELFGADSGALATDKLVRTLGWRRVAESELEQADPATRRYLEAYARGVNDYLRGRSAAELSLNYPLIGVDHPMRAVEPWTPVDSLTWFKALAWQLRGGYEEEISRALAFGVIRDVSRVDQLYPAYPYGRHTPILPDGGRTATGTTPSPTKDGDAPGGGDAAVGDDAGASSATAPASKTTGTKADPKNAATRTTASRTTGKVPAPAKTSRTVRVAADAAPAAATGGPAAGDNRELARALAGPAQEVLARARKALTVSPVGGLSAGGDGIGSNSWVVSGRFTASGKPLLANDPHLAPGIPGVWYQVGLHCRTVSAACGFDVAGFSFSGVPGVFIGHNARISWGLTNLGPDVTDLYLEKVSEDRVERDGQEQALTLRQETIAVAGAPDVTITVRTGPHGPLVSDVVPELETVGARAPAGRNAVGRGQGYAVALTWTALSPGHDMDALFAINLAQNFDAFRKGAQLMDAPAQNLVYADVDGHIGYQAPGQIPVRSRTAPQGGNRADAVPTDGTWPLPGWTSAYDWKSYVPAAEMPWTLDPDEGYIVAANQAVTPQNGKVVLGRDFDYGYRSERIRERLTEGIARGKLTTGDMESIQNDTRNGMADQLVPLLRQAKISDQFYAEAVHLLDGWDGNQPVDSPAAAFFNAVWASLLELTFSDELPEGSRPDGGSRWFEVVRNLLGDAKDPWWDDRTTPSVLETRDEIIRQSIIRARNQLTRNIGKDPDTWTWGRLHQLTLTSQPLGGLVVTVPLHPLLNAGPLAMPGGSAIVDALGWDASSGDFDVVWAPSMRMVVDLGDLDRSRWGNQTGQSGHPGSDHYTDQLDAWARGKTYPWPSSGAAVKAATEETLTFRPSG